jgi:hypothetical protein
MNCKCPVGIPPPGGADVLPFDGVPVLVERPFQAAEPEYLDHPYAATPPPLFSNPNPPTAMKNCES